MSGFLPIATTRQPRVLVLADGAELEGVLSVGVTANNYLAADRFEVALAASADAATALELADRDRIEIEILAGDDGMFDTLIVGQADLVTLDPARGVLRLEGRDLSARLIESRVEEGLVNLTSSEIVTRLAGRHGLEVDAQATRVPVGRLWERSRDRLLLDQYARATTEWDLIAALADVEGFDVWVRGRTLHFRPPEADATPILLDAAALEGLRLERALSLAGGIEVIVRSWNAEQQHAIAEQASSGEHGKARRYVYVVPNLTRDEAARLARRRLGDLGRQERSVAIEMPGETAIAPRGRIALVGTGTGFDQTYRVDRVERHLSFAAGFRQTVHARAANEE